MTMFENPSEHFTIPNGHQVEFLPETHQYFVEGSEVPSITTLLSRVYGDIYGAVNPELLKRAADYGTAVHDELQRWIELRKIDADIPIITTYQEVNNYFSLVEDIYRIKPIMTEQVVVLYDDSGLPASAGRFDLLCTVNGDLTLADFKTTSVIHRKQVTAQLNLYLRAARQSGYLASDPAEQPVKLAAIQLSGEKSKLLPIQVLGPQFYQQFIF